MNRKIALLALSLLAATPTLASAEAQSPGAAAALRRAEFSGQQVSPEVRHIADWAVHSGDHARLPFIVVDKVNAKLSAFDPNGRLLRTVPVLLGMGIGDAFAPGVIGMDMYQTKPWQRVTPAGASQATHPIVRTSSRKRNTSPSR